MSVAEKPAIGRTWDTGEQLVEAGHVLAYAAATQDLRDAYDGPAAIAPPMFHVRLMKPLLFAIVLDPELGLDVLHLLHASHDASFHRPLRPGDRVHCHGELLGFERKRGGVLLTAGLYGDLGSRRAVTARTAFFIRDPSAEKRERAAPPAPRQHPDWRSEQLLAADQSLRYASASLDDNPIHTRPEVARAAGLPDVVVQGLCTMAIACARTIDAACDGDPARLERMSVRFARPVFNGDRLSVMGWRRPGARPGWDIEVRSQRGEAVLSNGLALLRDGGAR